MSSVTTVACDKYGCTVTNGSATRCMLFVGKSGEQDYTAVYDVCSDCCPVATDGSHGYRAIG